MLELLRIKNVALVDDLTLELEPGYVAITGETGAGKSVLMGALGCLLGGRADRALVRSGADQAAVEGVFRVDRAGLAAAVGAILDRHGLEACEGGRLRVRRVVSVAGANRQFVNGSATSLGVLEELGDLLIDLHGPHEHQSLLRPGSQADVLDAFVGAGALRERLEALVDGRAALAKQLRDLEQDPEAVGREAELLRHQAMEIEAARLRAGEEEELEPEFVRGTNAARLVELGAQARGILSEGESSLADLSGSLGRVLQELKKVDAEAGCLLSLHEQALSFWQDLQSDLGRYLDRVEIDEERLRVVGERLDVLRRLKHKYGPTVDAVIEYGEQARARLARLEGREAELARLRSELERAGVALAEACAELSSQRRKGVGRLAKAVKAQLEDLGFRQAGFAVTVEPREVVEEATRRGWDRVEFQFAPNVGEPARPLKAIASAGEMARVMLAMKTVLAAQDAVPVLVFDELDANVGGETAARVGDKLREIGASHQVLCITHLAPVAARAGTQYRVVKRERAGRAVTEVVRLGESERLEELARMLGGVTEASRRLAASMLAGA